MIDCFMRVQRVFQTSQMRQERNLLNGKHKDSQDDPHQDAIGTRFALRLFVPGGIAILAGR